MNDLDPRMESATRTAGRGALGLEVLRLLPVKLEGTGCTSVTPSTFTDYQSSSMAFPRSMMAAADDNWPNRTLLSRAGSRTRSADGEGHGLSRAAGLAPRIGDGDDFGGPQCNHSFFSPSFPSTPPPAGWEVLEFAAPDTSRDVREMFNRT